MPKNKLSDIDEILAKSQRLTTHFGESGQTTRNLSRGVLELNEASKQLAYSSSRDQNNINAFRFLTQKNFDAKKLYDEVNSIVLDTDDDVPQLLEGTDIEGYLAHHQDMTVLGTIEQANRASEHDVREMKERWAADEWASAKAQFMEGLGHRSYCWEGVGNSSDLVASSYGSSTSLFTPGKYGSGFGSTPAKIQDARSSSFQTNTPAAGSPFNIKSLMTRPGLSTPGAVLSSYPVTPGSVTIADSLNRLRARPINSEFMNNHAHVVRELAMLSHGKTTQLVQPCISLAEAIVIPQQVASKGVVQDGLTKSDLTSYKSLLEYLANIVGEVNSTENIAPGFFSAVSIEAAEVTATFRDARKKLLTSGAKQYFEAQIWEIWSRAVDTAVYNGDLVVLPSAYGTSRQQRLRSYVSYQYRIGAIPRESGAVLSPALDHVNTNSIAVNARRNLTSALEPITTAQHGDTPLWAYVYHCLRTGDLEGAAEELERCVAHGYHEGEAFAATAVRLLSVLLSTRKTLSDHELNTLADAMAKCRTLHEQEVARSETADDSDPFRLVVLNLLGAADRDSLANSPIPGFSLEDFLWANLWFIQVFRGAGAVLNAQRVQQARHSLNNFGENNARAKAAGGDETDLFDLIQEYGGADYFDRDRSTPFKYATVLFACHRFGDAVAHLWTTNKTVPAVHLAVICLHYGLILPHQPLSQNPAHSVGGSRSTNVVDPTPSAMLQLFFGGGAFQHYPEVIADYLVALDSNWMPFAQGLDGELKEVHKLKSQSTLASILDTFVTSLDRDALTAVVGQPSDLEGLARGSVRSAGRLDDYLQKDAINLLLSRSAYHLLTQSREAENAIYLYQLAGRYTDVLEEMCKQLAGVLVPPSLSFSFPGSATPQQQYQQHQYNLTQQAQREQWRVMADNFVGRYLRSVSHSAVLHQLTQCGNQDLPEVLITLVGLFKAVDAYGENDYASALDLLDAQNLLPTSESHLDMFSSLKPHLKTVVDDLILIALDSSKTLYQQLKASRVVAASGTPFKQPPSQFNAQFQSQSLGLTTDKDLKMQGLLTRARALVAFANRIKGKLNRQDTASIAARMEATFI